MSAAKAEPAVTIASAVANKAIFFMTIPITSSKTPVRIPEAPGTLDLTATIS